MTELNPRDFLVPVVMTMQQLLKDLYNNAYFTDVLGVRVKLYQGTTGYGGHSTKTLIQGGDRYSSQNQFSVTVHPDSKHGDLPISVYRFDSKRWQLENAAASLAVADGAESWVGLHEEDKARWLKLAAAVTQDVKPTCPLPEVELLNPTTKEGLR